MVPRLPDDILHLVSIQLWHQRDFNTLFNLALSCRQLAELALSSIYRMHNVAPFTNSGSDEIEVLKNVRPADSHAQQGTIISRWAGLWRAMILSSLGLTIYPYCRYIRALDLRDLKELLEDTRFRAEFSDGFFSGPLAQFRIEVETPATTRSKNKNRRPLRLNTTATLEGIAEVMAKNSPMLEELDGEVKSAALSRWIPRLQRLQQMTLWSGSALTDGVGCLIHVHCPNFKTLRFYEWCTPKTDSLFATFLQELRPQSLESLEIFSYSNIGAETFLALNNHSHSLQELKLNNVRSEAMKDLSMLKGCIALTSLLITEVGGFTDLETYHKDTLLEIISWLIKCKKLHTIVLGKLFNSPAILTPVLLDNNIRLVGLEVTFYDASKAKDFHLALAHQPSLRSLLLKADGDDCDCDMLVESLSQLRNLTILRLSNISDYFRDEHVCKLARNLLKLEELWTSGWDITDAIWTDMAGLQHLHRFDMNAWSSFTLDGLLGYISHLGDGNRGLALAIMMADPENALSDEEQSFVRKALATKAEGRFDYTLARDPNPFDYSGSDSE